MSAFVGDWQGLWLLLIVGVLPNEIWVIWLLAGRSVLAGVIGAELVLLGGKWWLG
jgi:hypothetical protein